MPSTALIRLENALFKKAKVPVFNKHVNFEILPSQRWAIIGTHKSQFLQALAGEYLTPGFTRSYPFLNKRAWPTSVIQLLEFQGVLPTAHLAARYEFFKDEFDETTQRFVIGNVNNHRIIDMDLVKDVFERLKLEGLEKRWALGLSNGQTRRARLARALVREPKLLLIDDPFLGLDPNATDLVSEVLGDLPPNPHVVLGLRIQDKIPDWITHVALVDENGVTGQGSIAEMNEQLCQLEEATIAKHETDLRTQAESIKRVAALFKKEPVDRSTPLLEFHDVSVAYRGQPVLQDLRWKVLPGERWHVRGNNGTGKSTLLSLITAEHPQSWNRRIVMNGVPRRTGRQSFFGINESIGFTSPELHSIYPRDHTVQECFTTGFLVGSMVPPKSLTIEQSHIIDTMITEFGLESKRDETFRSLSISDQKLVLLLRSLVKSPELLILDEALSVMEDANVQKCKELLRHFPGTILAIGHIQDEVPDCDWFIKLVSPGEYEVGYT